MEERSKGRYSGVDFRGLKTKYLAIMGNQGYD